MNETGQVFWLDAYSGTVKSGAFIRCNLNQCIKILNKNGATIVGIKLDLESDNNVELIIEQR